MIVATLAALAVVYAVGAIVGTALVAWENQVIFGRRTVLKGEWEFIVLWPISLSHFTDAIRTIQRGW